MRQGAASTGKLGETACGGTDSSCLRGKRAWQGSDDAGGIWRHGFANSTGAASYSPINSTSSYFSYRTLVRGGRGPVLGAFSRRGSAVDLRIGDGVHSVAGSMLQIRRYGVLSAMKPIFVRKAAVGLVTRG
jgi:hypothetical protein